MPPGNIVRDALGLFVLNYTYQPLPLRPPLSLHSKVWPEISVRAERAAVHVKKGVSNRMRYV